MNEALLDVSLLKSLLPVWSKSSSSKLDSSSGSEELKRLARDKTDKSAEDRNRLWLLNLGVNVPQVDLDANRNVFRDTCQALFSNQETLVGSVPSLSLSWLNNDYCLNQRGREAVVKILNCVAYNAPDVQQCGLLYPVVAILLHYLSEPDCYCYAQQLLSTKNPVYLSHSETERLQEAVVMLYFQEQYNKKYVKRLKALGGDSVLKDNIEQWLKWLFHGLPLRHLMAMMDCYLVEGRKVLFRVSIALLRFFIKQALSKEDFKEKLSSQNLTSSLIEYCSSAEFPDPQQLLKKAFGLRAFKRSDIVKQLKKSNVDLRQRSRSLDQQHVVTLGNFSCGTLTAKQGFSTPQPRRLHHQVVADIVAPICLRSQILSSKHLSMLWGHLPVRMRTVEPSLAFSSNEHGLSINTFYSRAERYEPTILLIKTTRNIVIGAYCSTRWSERRRETASGGRQMYFGTGETFVFRVNGDNVDVFEWVGKNVCDDDQEERPKGEKHAEELFMCAQPDMFTIGGGDGNAIQVSSNLTSGRSEPCNTFHNPCLCHDGNKDFDIALIEVIGLNYIEE